MKPDVVVVAVDDVAAAVVVAFPKAPRVTSRRRKPSLHSPRHFEAFELDDIGPVQKWYDERYLVSTTMMMIMVTDFDLKRDYSAVEAASVRFWLD